ncbi:FixH family protein [Kordiimonas sp. SCSIO 12610]|uniref:FixH family protein n=1 Tax=Kordiimonas sp. SCSIO 12610 TaxID=2829597 RepID=UPI00210EFFEF|nr:FixH family protein [Kordiimonas sp. SCSIO 12610]UTW55592.1 FixH family protein [Kordiimonas sp. SCSIO 12610]
MTVSMHMNDKNPSSGPRPSDKWIPWYFVAFFVFLAIVNVIFIYIASSTHSGVVTDHAYAEGLRYNETIAAAKAQEQLGWLNEITVKKDVITFSLRDSENALNGASVTAEFVNPTRSGEDFSLSLKEMGNGVYEAELPSGIIGQWDVRMQVEWQQIQYQTSKRIVIAA